MSKKCYILSYSPFSGHGQKHPITEKLKDGTYEKVMAKSDLQLGIESLQRIKQSDY